jgi:L-lysine exporter family protein LysE/ArgO
MLSAFLHGFLLAIGLIIPLGVQNFFIFSQGATRSKFRDVLPVVVTASLCDCLLIILAVSGVSLVVMNFIWMQTVLVILGTLFLLYMGYMTWKAQPPERKDEVRGLNDSRKLITYTLMISILNPHAILDTIGVIGTSSLNYEGSERLLFTLACITVSCIWFLFLALLGRFVGSKDHSGKIVRYLNKASAAVMWAAALFLILTL